MGTSEVRFQEGENLIGLCCSDELHFFSFFLYFLLRIFSGFGCAQRALAASPNWLGRDAREIYVVFTHSSQILIIPLASRTARLGSKAAAELSARVL